MTRSVVFWTLIFSLLIGLIVGVAIHWVLGVVLFFAIAAPSMKTALIIDIGSSWLKYHHDRTDHRQHNVSEVDKWLQERQIIYDEYKRQQSIKKSGYED